MEVLLFTSALLMPWRKVAVVEQVGLEEMEQAHQQFLVEAVE
jgi:hypothetical protein